MDGLHQDLALALELADLADELTMASFTGHSVTFTVKPDGSPVTETDLVVEMALREMLRERRPNDGFLGEETGEVRTMHVATNHDERIRWTCQPPLPDLEGERTELAERLHRLGAYQPPAVQGPLDVAAGTVDVCLHLGGAEWDYGAFVAIVTGAGGRFRYLDGNASLRPTQPALFTNGTTHTAALAALAR